MQLNCDQVTFRVAVRHAPSGAVITRGPVSSDVDPIMTSAEGRRIITTDALFIELFAWV